jgi:hypothetical protein
MESEGQAEDAKNLLSGTTVLGHRITVDFSMHPQIDPSRVSTALSHPC